MMNRGHTVGDLYNMLTFTLCINSHGISSMVLNIFNKVQMEKNEGPKTETLLRILIVVEN